MRSEEGKEVKWHRILTKDEIKLLQIDEETPINKKTGASAVAGEVLRGRDEAGYG